MLRKSLGILTAALFAAMSASVSDTYWYYGCWITAAVCCGLLLGIEDVMWREEHSPQKPDHPIPPLPRLFFGWLALPPLPALRFYEEGWAMAMWAALVLGVAAFGMLLPYVMHKMAGGKPSFNSVTRHGG